MAEHNWKKVKDLDAGNDFLEPKPTRQYAEPIGPKKPSTMERVMGNPMVQKVKGWMENHPHNQRSRRERPERSERKEPKRKGSVSRIDRYEDGKVKETVYFSTHEAIPRQKKAKKPKSPRRGGDILGGLGSGMSMRDFIPPGMTFGSPMQPMGRKPRKSRGGDGGDWTDPGYIPPSLREFF